MQARSNYIFWMMWLFYIGARQVDVLWRLPVVASFQIQGRKSGCLEGSGHSSKSNLLFHSRITDLPFHINKT